MDQHAGAAGHARIDQLPVLPGVVLALMNLDPAADGFFEDVLALASDDPTLAVRIVRAANSATSAPVSPIETLPAAVARLGAANTIALVTSVAVTRVFVPTTHAQASLWAHSIEVAVTAQLIAERCNNVQIESSRAYLSGLLHDIGRFVMFGECSELDGSVDEVGWATPDEVIAAERAAYGFDHAELGYLVCRRWGLPARIAEVTRDHHDTAADWTSRDDGHGRFLALVQAADRLSMLRRSDADWEFANTATRAARIAAHEVDPDWPVLPLSPLSLARILHEVEPAVVHAIRHLGLERKLAAT